MSDADETGRPYYWYCVQNAAELARRLGVPAISVVELGVAGGIGLVELEKAAAYSSEATDVAIHVAGFDLGSGLPAPVDYRDLPYHWRQGFYSMDEDLLRARLDSADLVLGDVGETLPRYFASLERPPLAGVMCDLDLYSSTSRALKVFDLPSATRLPRVFCYFDDIIGGEIELYNDFTGERLAITEFNDAHEKAKLSPAYYLTTQWPQVPWHHQIYILHDFDHPDYCRFVSDEDQELTLRPGG